MRQLSTVKYMSNISCQLLDSKQIYFITNNTPKSNKMGDMLKELREKSKKRKQLLAQTVRKTILIQVDRFVFAT